MASPVRSSDYPDSFLCHQYPQIKSLGQDTLFDVSSPLYTVAPSTFSNLVILNLLTKPPDAATVPFFRCRALFTIELLLRTNRHANSFVPFFVLVCYLA